MNAAQAEAYLLDLELFGMRFGLDRMHKLMTVLGMPQRRFASIHVVGSNGKSSTVRFLAAIIRTVEDLPFDPTTCTWAKRRCGIPSTVISLCMRSSPNRIPNSSRSSR